MSDTMGTFRIDFELENPMRAGDRRVVRNALVDTGAEFRGFPPTSSNRWALSTTPRLDFDRPMGPSSSDGPERHGSMSPESVPRMTWCSARGAT